MNIVCFHQSVSRWGNEEPENYTHLISLPRIYSLLAQFGTSFKFWVLEVLHLFCQWLVLLVHLVQLVARPVGISYCCSLPYITHGQHTLSFTTVTLTVHTQNPNSNNMCYLLYFLWGWVCKALGSSGSNR